MRLRYVSPFLGSKGFLPDPSLQKGDGRRYPLRVRRAPLRGPGASNWPNRCLFASLLPPRLPLGAATCFAIFRENGRRR